MRTRSLIPLFNGQVALDVSKVADRGIVLSMDEASSEWIT